MNNGGTLRGAASPMISAQAAKPACMGAGDHRPETTRAGRGGFLPLIETASDARGDVTRKPPAASFSDNFRPSLRGMADPPC